MIVLPDSVSDIAKPAATALTAVGAAIAIWATYKAAEEWDDPAKPGKERLTSWGKFAILLLLVAGALGTCADVSGDPNVRRLQVENDSLRIISDSVLAEVRRMREQLHASTHAESPRPSSEQPLAPAKRNSAQPQDTSPPPR